MKLPNVVKYLLIANIVVWILSEILTMRGIDVSPLCLFYVGSGKFMPHQVVTYMFMHAGFMHLFFNMFALFMFGRIMAMTWGEKKFLIYYLVCGVGAAITQEVGQLTGLLETNSCTLGASGAVFGILLAFGLTYPNERIFIIPIPFPIKAIYFVFFYIALEVIEFLSIKDGIAHLAHLGGMLFGWLLPQWRFNKQKRKYLRMGNKTDDPFGIITIHLLLHHSWTISPSSRRIRRQCPQKRGCQGNR